MAFRRYGGGARCLPTKGAIARSGNRYEYSSRPGYPGKRKGSGMSNIATWIEQIANGEQIEAAVVGSHDRMRWDAVPDHTVGRVMPWAEARIILDYEYNSGYGSADCHPVFAWTATKVITVTEYDGATGPTWFPRHPIDITPSFDGVEFDLRIPQPPEVTP